MFEKKSRIVSASKIFDWTAHHSINVPIINETVTKALNNTYLEDFSSEYMNTVLLKESIRKNKADDILWIV